MKHLTYLLLLLLIPVNVLAKERPMAILKAQYDAWHKTKNTKDGKTNLTEQKYILQIGNGESYFYDPQTFFVDSMEHDPNGKTIISQTEIEAIKEAASNGTDFFNILKEKGLLAGSGYKNQKNFQEKKITVWNKSGETYQYDVDMNDLTWEIGDSTTTILNYECNVATADYHGRKWTAWFTPEIAVQEGPWQLCGLPGLIMKAETDDSEYGFEITGLQQCNEPFKPTFINPKTVYMTKRKSFLKMSDYSRRNRGAMISAMTRGKVNKKNIDYKGKSDYLETDYHETEQSDGK